MGFPIIIEGIFFIYENFSRNFDQSTFIGSEFFVNYIGKHGFNNNAIMAITDTASNLLIIIFFSFILDIIRMFLLVLVVTRVIMKKISLKKLRLILSITSMMIGSIYILIGISFSFSLFDAINFLTITPFVIGILQIVWAIYVKKRDKVNKKLYYISILGFTLLSANCFLFLGILEGYYAARYLILQIALLTMSHILQISIPFIIIKKTILENKRPNTLNFNK
jgi:hypothetical protein